LTIVPATDDTGILSIGNTTRAIDTRWYGTTATSIATFDAGNNQLTLAGIPISSNAAIVTTTAVNAATMKTTGDINAASITVVGAVNTATVKTTGDINAASITVVGAVNTATVKTTGDINAASITVVGAVNTATVNFTGAMTPSANAFYSSKAVTTQATASLTANALHFNSMIQITQANATTITLPAPASTNLGAKVTVACLTNAAHVVASANTIIALTSLVADTMTAAETDKTGQTITLQSDAAKWVVLCSTGSWTVGVA
jgi:predicted DNA-binding protein with PD1-like motif